MPNAAAPSSDARRAALFIAAVTLWRVGTLAFDRTELWVDEAQYWLWGQHLDWGYFSKPPLIAFWLRAVTDLAGSDHQFFIRVSGPLLHALTAAIIGLFAGRLFGGNVGPWAAALYVTTPFAAVGSWQFSTDTVMLPCFALGLLAWTHLRIDRSLPWALTLGLAAGLGMMGKYAAIYLPLLLALAALLVPSARIAWRDAGIAAVTALGVLAPNLIWNLQNGGTTFRHVAEDNAQLGNTSLDLAAGLEFLASQLAVFGPVLLLALLFVLVTWPKRGPESRALLLLSLPVILFITIQAARAGAYANWAVTAYVAGTALAAATLGPRLLKLSLALGLIFAVTLPFAYMTADTLRLPSGALLAKRYIGPEALARAVDDTARAEDLPTIVTPNRGVIAGLFYDLRDSGLAFHAPPVTGVPHSFYEQSFALPPDLTGDVLYVAYDPPECAGAPDVGAHAPSEGRYAGRRIGFWRVSATCLRP